MKQIFRLKRHGLFDARVPRFTTFPPVNWFQSEFEASKPREWRSNMPDGAEISMYVHIPFCKRLCWFCACRTQGTQSLEPLENYVSILLDEARIVRRELPGRIKVARLHLGGGTPTILPAPLLERLLEGLNETYDLANLQEFSAEIDPTDVGPSRIAVLKRWGLSRASLGVQDFDEKVQAAIGRSQPLADTQKVVEMLQDAGVRNLNFDLIYGLPHQTKESLTQTLNQVLSMDPGRIALFGYAHVPWMSKRQVMIPQEALPDPMTRYELFNLAVAQLVPSGYSQIGIDHFAQDRDSLLNAYRSRKLRRTLQGYTDDDVPHLVALGASAISRYPEGFTQNNPATGQYARALRASELPVFRGYQLDPQDTALGRVVEDLMCYFEAEIPQIESEFARRTSAVVEKYGDAVSIDGNKMIIEDWARPLARLIAAEFLQLPQRSDQPNRYSLAI